MTFSIVARERGTGLLGIAQSTSPLSVGGRCPFFRANVGAVCTQAFTDPGLGPLGIELLALGYSPDKVIEELVDSDRHSEWRQIGIVDRNGRTAVFTGAKCEPFSDAIMGDGYILMGNYLLRDDVVKQMDVAWKKSEGKLFEDRLMEVVTAGRDAGGDRGGHRSSCLIVYDTETYARTDLRIDYAPAASKERPDAVTALQEILEIWKPMIPYYKERPHNPSMPGWRDWLAAQGMTFRE